MSVPFSNTKLRVPSGFQAVLEDLAKEVLRSQPPDIYAFAALHFGKMLKIREEGGLDPADQCAQLQDRFYNNTAFDQQEIDPNSKEQQSAATTIQTKYRQHHAVGVVQDKREEQAAVTIQSGFRGYQSRTEVRHLRDDQQRQDASDKEKLADGNEAEEIDIDLNDPEVEAAAMKIQSGFKQFKQRKDDRAEPKVVEKSMAVAEKMEAEEEEIDIDLTDPEVEKAATKIQAGFKGFKARKEMDAMKPDDEPEKAAATAEDDEEIDIDLNDPEVEKAAIKIQAGFSGYKARKELKESVAGKEVATEETTTEVPEKAAAKEEEEIDIDLEDPEVEQATIKSQEGFKSFKAGKTVKEDEETPAERAAAEPKVDEAKPEEEEIDIDLDDPEVEKAAFKIQAGFKGFKARKEMKEGQETKEDEEGGEKPTTEGADEGATGAEETEDKTGDE